MQPWPYILRISSDSVCCLHGDIEDLKYSEEITYDRRIPLLKIYIHEIRRMNDKYMV